MLVRILFFTLFTSSAFASQLIAKGNLQPGIPTAKAQGSVFVVLENDGTQAVYFGSDYAMSSGVVLDLKLCGQVYAGAKPICLSQGEVRKLKGEYRMPVRFPLYRYTELVIFDVDLVQNHARAQLN